jgi:hypothetical protein
LIFGAAVALLLAWYADVRVRGDETGQPGQTGQALAQ